MGRFSAELAWPSKVIWVLARSRSPFSQTPRCDLNQHVIMTETLNAMDLTQFTFWE